MTMQVTPHINFRGEARAALEFYRDAFDGELVIATFADFGAVERPEEADQVIWGQVEAASGFRVMAFDVPASRPFSRGDSSFFVSARGIDADEMTAAWRRLQEGATVLHPLGPAPWSPLYGMLVDRFGVTWVVDVAA